eukprot:6039669-Amphidinium_carterae.1
MIFLAVVTQEEPPLAVFELLDRIYHVLQRYLGEVSEDTLRQNFSMVYLLLDEMIDSGLPFTTELNSLEAIIAPPSTISKVSGDGCSRSHLVNCAAGSRVRLASSTFLKRAHENDFCSNGNTLSLSLKVVQAVGGTSTQVLSDVPPDARGQSTPFNAISSALGAGNHTQIGGASAEVWWRRQNVVYASNEVSTSTQTKRPHHSNPEMPIGDCFAARRLFDSTDFPQEVYIDIVEAVDCICDGNGNMVSGGISGDILVNSKLSGLPE